jgi:hypothetical protein
MQEWSAQLSRQAGSSQPGTMDGMRRTGTREGTTADVEAKPGSKAQPDKKVRRRFNPTVAEARTDDLAGLAQLPGGLIATAAVGTLQALAAQIGRVQGNQHLQRVVACLKRDEREADPKPAHGQL